MTPGSSSSGGSSPEKLRPEQMLRMGLEGRVEREVPREWTIAAYDPRLPDVLSTPAMIGMMEVAAATAVQPFLPANAITVGTRIEVDHVKAVPTGAHVVATARLTKLEGRFLVFEVEAKSREQVIGSGRVFRTIVEITQFSNAAVARKNS